MITAAVEEWLRTHGEEAVIESYRRRYAAPDPTHDALVARLGAFSAAACLAANGR